MKHLISELLALVMNREFVLMLTAILMINRYTYNVEQHTDNVLWCAFLPPPPTPDDCVG